MEQGVIQPKIDKVHLMKKIGKQTKYLVSYKNSECFSWLPIEEMKCPFQMLDFVQRDNDKTKSSIVGVSKIGANMFFDVKIGEKLLTIDHQSVKIGFEKDLIEFYEKHALL